MMIRSVLTCVLAVLVGCSANSFVHGHEIKVLASRLAIPVVPAKTTVYLSWGHRLPVDDLVDAASIERYDLLDPKGAAKSLHKADVSLQTNVVELADEGLYQVVVDKKASIFSYVFDAEGVRRLKRGPKSGITEGKVDTASRYRQCAKALLVVGKPSDAAPKPVGQTMEIVPLEGSARWVDNASIRFQVLLESKPLSSAEVTARYVGYRPDDAWNYATTSDRRGEFTIRPTHPGTWVIKVHTQRLTQGALREQYDFDSYTATLALEIRP